MFERNGGPFYRYPSETQEQTKEHWKGRERESETGREGANSSDGRTECGKAQIYAE